MIPRPKRLPRLWCALQGLLPWEAGPCASRLGPAWARTDHERLAPPGLTDLVRAAGTNPGEAISPGKVQSTRESER